MRTTDELIENFHNLLEATQARLTLTEAALSAAINLINMSTAETVFEKNGSIMCPHCDVLVIYELHKMDCLYRQAEIQYDKAREALYSTRE